MKDGFTEEQVQERGVVGLDHEEEELFERDSEDGGPKDRGLGVRPDGIVDEVRVPGSGRDDGYLGHVSVWEV